MCPYLAALLIVVLLLHCWKKIAWGKILDVRNSFTTIASQLVDTTLVVFVLFVGTLPFGTMADYIWDGWLFKATAAAFDTVLIYAFMWWARRFFKLELGEEIAL